MPRKGLLYGLRSGACPRSPISLPRSHSIFTRSLLAAQVPFEDIPRLPAILEAMRPAELRAKREPMSKARPVWPASLTPSDQLAEAGRT